MLDIKSARAWNFTQALEITRVFYPCDFFCGLLLFVQRLLRPSLGEPNLYNKQNNQNNQKMKKLITQASAVVFAFAFIACSSEEAGAPVSDTDSAEETEDFSPDPGQPTEDAPEGEE